MEWSLSRPGRKGPGLVASGYAGSVPVFALLWAAAFAGPYDTTELVVLGQPIPLVLTWRPEHSSPEEGLPSTAIQCLISVTAADKEPSVFNTSACPAEHQPLVNQVLKSARARPVSELGWGLKTWTQLRLALDSTVDPIHLDLLPAGTGEHPELHFSEVSVREQVEPTYPAEARWNRVTGTCSLHIRIDTKGRPAEVQPVRCSQGFAKASIEAVQDWRFKPHRVEGEAVVFDTVLTLDFKLPPQNDPEGGSSP